MPYKADANYTRLWRYNPRAPKPNCWRLVMTLSDETIDIWTKIYRNNEPDCRFKVTRGPLGQQAYYWYHGRPKGKVT